MTHDPHQCDCEACLEWWRVRGIEPQTERDVSHRPKLLGIALEDSQPQADGLHIVRVLLMPGVTVVVGQPFGEASHDATCDPTTGPGVVNVVTPSYEPLGIPPWPEARDA